MDSVLPAILPAEYQAELALDTLARLFSQNMKWSELEQRLPELKSECRTLNFMRFGEAPSAIILVPEAFSHLLPPANREFDRTEKPANPDAEQNCRPQVRKSRVSLTGTPAKKGYLAIESIQARVVTLKLSPTRITEWGIEHRLLNLLGSGGSAPGGFPNWFSHHKLEWMSAAPTMLLEEIFRGAYHLAYEVRRLRTLPALAKLQYPLIHNQRGGNRFLLFTDQKRLGSPADCHVLVYKGTCPKLEGWISEEKSNVREHKPALLLAATQDNRVRFYQPTEAQWTEWGVQWEASWPELSKSINATDRAIIETGVRAAQELRNADAAFE